MSGIVYRTVTYLYKRRRKLLVRPQPRYSEEEFARRGDEIYEREIRPRAKTGDERKFVVIDIDTGAYEIDKNELAASDRVLARHSDVQLWVTRVGSRYARRFGRRERGNVHG